MEKNAQKEKDRFKIFPYKVEEELKELIGPLEEVKTKETGRTINLLIHTNLGKPGFQADYLDIIKYNDLFDNKSYRNIHKDDRYFDHSNIRRIINPLTRDRKKINRKMMRTFLLIIGVRKYEEQSYLEDELEVSEPEDQNRKQIEYADLLKGGWDVFILDSASKTSSVKRTQMFLEKENEESLDAYFINLDEDEMEGKATIDSQKRLSIHLKCEKTNSITDIHALLPNKGNILISERWMIHAGGITNQYKSPIIGRIIMIKRSGFNTKRNILNQEIQIVKFNDENIPSTENKIEPSFINEILIYLNRHPSRKMRKIGNYDDIVRRNSIWKTNNNKSSYSLLKDKLENKDEEKSWYSFSRVRPGTVSGRAEQSSVITIFQWEFQFDDYKQTCRAIRHVIGKPNTVKFQGDVFLEGDNLFMNLTESGSKNKKYFIAKFAKGDTELNRIRGISTSLISANLKEAKGGVIGFRELLVLLPNNKLLSKFYNREEIDYDTFLNQVDELKLNEKLYLVSRSRSVVTYPVISDALRQYYKMRAACSFVGSYICFIQDLEDSSDSLKISGYDLEIDSLGRTTLKVSDSDGKNIRSYQGYAEVYQNNLHISLQYMHMQHNEQEYLSLLFQNIRMKEAFIAKLDVFSGIMKSISPYGDSYSTPFIVVRKKLIKEKNFKPKSYSINDIVIQKLKKEIPPKYKFPKNILRKAIRR